MLELESPLVCYLSQAACISSRYEGTLASQQEIEYFITLYTQFYVLLNLLLESYF